VVDPASGAAGLSTPRGFSEQLQRLDEIAPKPDSRPGLSGIFLTHRHIGHYAGLMYLGKEVIGAKDLPSTPWRDERSSPTTVPEHWCA